MRDISLQTMIQNKGDTMEDFSMEKNESCFAYKKYWNYPDLPAVHSGMFPEV